MNKRTFETDQENTQSPSQNKTITERLELEINAELSAIQRALVGFVGIAAVSAITDDGYNDDVPPVITINGDNPATVEVRNILCLMLVQPLMMLFMEQQQ